MPAVNYQGIILRTVQYSETSVIFDCYTIEEGLLSFIISGVRKKRAKVSAQLLRPMSLVALTGMKGQGELIRVKELYPTYIYQSVPFELYKGTVGLFLTEVLQKICRAVPAANLEFYTFIEQLYTLLDQTEESIANFPLWFLCQLLPHQGIQLPEVEGKALYWDYREAVFVEEPLLGGHYMAASSLLLFQHLGTISFEEAAQWKSTRKERNTELDALLAYYHYQLDGFKELNTLKVMRDLFA